MIRSSRAHERQRGDLLRRARGRVSDRRPAGPLSAPILTEMTNRPARPFAHLGAHRLGGITGKEPGIARSRVHAPEQQDVATISDLAQRCAWPGHGAGRPEVLLRRYPRWRCPPWHGEDHSASRRSAVPESSDRVRCTPVRARAAAPRRLAASLTASSTVAGWPARRTSQGVDPSPNQDLLYRAGGSGFDDPAVADSHDEVVTAAAAAEAGHVGDSSVRHAARCLPDWVA